MRGSNPSAASLRDQVLIEMRSWPKRPARIVIQTWSMFSGLSCGLDLEMERLAGDDDQFSGRKGKPPPGRGRDFGLREAMREHVALDAQRREIWRELFGTGRPGERSETLPLFGGLLFFRGALQERDLLDARGIGRAPGADFRIVLEGFVHDPAFVGIHRLELERTARKTDALGELADVLHDLVLAHRAIHLAIDNPLRRIRILRLEEAIEKELDAIEGFAVAPDQPIGLLGVDLSVGLPLSLLRFLDLHNETEIAEHRVEQFFRVYGRSASVLISVLFLFFSSADSLSPVSAGVGSGSDTAAEW